jgi:hypothetical protein
LAEARRAALDEDARGYTVSKDVYAKTPRAKHTAREDKPQ